ncbi:MAG TPA: hypothetical protein VGA99_03405 [bacterium]
MPAGFWRLSMGSNDGYPTDPELSTTGGSALTSREPAAKFHLNNCAIRLY